MACAHPALPPDLFAALLPEARAGSPAALGGLLAPWWPWLVRLAGRYIPRLLRAKIDAADLVQETMLEAQRAFPRFDGRTPEALSGWLVGILRHRGLHVRRRFAGGGKRDPALEIALDGLGPDAPLLEALEDPAPAPGDVLMAEEVGAALEQALARLPAEAEAVVRWRYCDGVSWQKIARRLGCSEDAARQRRGRALAALRAAVVHAEAAGVVHKRPRARPSVCLPGATAPPRSAEEAWWSVGIAGLMPWDPAGTWPVVQRTVICSLEWVPQPGSTGGVEVVTLATDGPYPALGDPATVGAGYRGDRHWPLPGPCAVDEGQSRPTVDAAVVAGRRPGEAGWQLVADLRRLEGDDRPVRAGRPDYVVC